MSPEAVMQCFTVTAGFLMSLGNVMYEIPFSLLIGSLQIGGVNELVDPHQYIGFL
jgi:hypothetical protein